MEPRLSDGVLHRLVAQHPPVEEYVLGAGGGPGDARQAHEPPDRDAAVVQLPIVVHLEQLLFQLGPDQGQGTVAR